MPAWHPHPSVWVVVGLTALGYWAAVTVLGPRLGERTSRRQVALIVAGVLCMWAAADYPIHDLAEDRLFSVHMIQHILFTLVVPPLLLVGTPQWLVRWLLARPGVARVVRWTARPLIAGLIYNAVLVFTHWPPVVDAGLNSEPVHFLLHCLIFVTALNMWFPVLNRLPEFPTLSPPARMIYLFLQSVIPTVPASFITFATGVIYEHYAEVPRSWDITVVADQQLAGALMKVVGGLILWGVIVVMFFRWYAAENHRPEEDHVLTWDDVERELERTSPPR